MKIVPSFFVESKSQAQKVKNKAASSEDRERSGPCGHTWNPAKTPKSYGNACPTCKRETARERYRNMTPEQKERYKQQCREGMKRFKEKRPDYLKEYRKKHPEKFKKHAGKREAKEKVEGLAYLEKAYVEALYAMARYLTAETGTPFEVDHIIPISKTGGQHAPWNLRVVPAAVNAEKNAKMPSESWIDVVYDQWQEWRPYEQ